MKRLKYITTILLSVITSQLNAQLDSTSYYPLFKGDWKEYSIYSDGGTVQGLVREGVVDTIVRNGQLYAKQFAGSPISNQLNYVRTDSNDNVLYLNWNTLLEDTLCIFDWDVASMERVWVVGEDLPGEGSGLTYGQLRLGYEYVGIPAYPYVDVYGKKLDYRWENYLFWSSIYSAGIGEVYYISEGFGKFIQKMKHGDQVSTGVYALNAIDTVTFTPDQIQFSNTGAGSTFDFDFSFDPSDYGWSSCTIGAVEYSLAPKSELYSINTTISGGGINPSAFSIQSIVIDSSRYVDCLDGRYINPIGIHSAPVNISGYFRAYALPSIPGLDEPGSTELMEVDSFQVSLIFTSVTVGLHEVSDMIQSFRLEKIYPNPFNPITTIEYELSEYSSITLVIYDIAGREVRTLISKHQDSGRYRETWDGTDKNGLDVPGGMYFVRIQAGNSLEVAKMTFLK